MTDIPKKSPSNNDAENDFLTAYDEFAEAIFRHCYFRVSDRGRAKELAQETFMRTWEYMASGRESVKNIRALLYRIAHNLVVDEYRRKKTQSLESLMEDDSFQPADPHDRSSREVLEARMVIHELMNRLNEADRQLITMRYLEDLSPKDIGAVLGQSENTVSVRVHRALKKMRIDLAGRVEEKPSATQ